jgi:hypothetical protein
MHPSALPLRTLSRAPLDGERSFHDLMAERLRQAPWLMVSLVLHGLVLLLAWLLLPAETRAALLHHVDVELGAEVEPPAQPVEPPPIEPTVEPLTDTVPVSDLPTVQPNDAADAAPGESADPTADASTTDWSATVGLSGPSQGLYGKRGKGSGPGTGGSGGTRPNLEAALGWLARHQDADGRWDCDAFMKHDDPALTICAGPGSAVHDVGVTALALLAFLGDNHTLRQGSHREVVRRGVLWLRSQQDENGRFGGTAAHDFVYDHAIATYAMCEAYGLSNYRTLRDSAQLGLDYLASHRDAYRAWRYQPGSTDEDLSITGWCVMAMKSGQHFGLAVDPANLQVASALLDRVASPNGHHGYRRAGEPSARRAGDHGVRFPAAKSNAMTAVGLFCRIFLGQDPREEPRLERAADLLLAEPPVWDPAGGSTDHYAWYYATYALYQMGGRRWTEWQRRLEPTVCRHQHLDGRQKNLHGSWDPIGPWGEDGGRVYSTAILTLTLQATFRYTRLLR